MVLRRDRSLCNFMDLSIWAGSESRFIRWKGDFCDCGGCDAAAIEHVGVIFLLIGVGSVIVFTTHWVLFNDDYCSGLGLALVTGLDLRIAVVVAVLIGHLRGLVSFSSQNSI